MENASKALLMAGGILLGILLLSGLVLMWTNISKLQASQSEAPKEEQIMKFNQEFNTYEGNDNIHGSDIISIVNKVISYNNKSEEVFVDKLKYEDVKVYLDVSGTNQSWKNKFYSSFGNSYTGEIIKNEDFNNFIQTYVNFEMGKPGKTVMQKLAANITKIDKLMNPTDGSTPLSEKDAINKVIGRDVVTGTSLTYDLINEYSEYSQFKTTKFKCDGTEINNNGQINKISFSVK